MSMDWGIAIAQNIISDILFVLGAVALGFVVLWLSGRCKLLRFFGTLKSRRIVIYLSRIGVVEGGAIGVDGQHRNYSGFTAPYGEIQAADQLRRLFEYLLPSVTADIPDPLRNILIADVEAVVVQSPATLNTVESAASLITLGSPAYNIASRYAEESLSSKVRFRLGQKHQSAVPRPQPENELFLCMQPSTASTELEGTHQTEQVADTTPSGDTSGSVPSTRTMPSGVAYDDTIQASEMPQAATGADVPSAILLPSLPPITGSDKAFIQRVIDPENQRYVFYVAGISELATEGAAYYLRRHWRKLARKYADNVAFAVVLQIDRNDYRRATVVLEHEVESNAALSS